MGKKVKNTDTIITDQDKKKSKNLAAKKQEQEEKEREKEQAQIEKSSKKIQKQSFEVKNLKKKKKQERLEKAKQPKLKEEKSEVQGVAEKLDENRFDQFINNLAGKYDKIRKRTIQTIKLDKELIKKASKALIKHHNTSKNQFNLLDNGEDFIYLEIIMSQVPEKYSVRPHQV